LEEKAEELEKTTQEFKEAEDKFNSVLQSKAKFLEPIQKEINRINNEKNPLVTQADNIKNKISTVEGDIQAAQQE